MATNEIKTFAGDSGANVVSQSTWAGLTTILANGFTSGVLPSNRLNKVLRQVSLVAAAVAQFVVNQGSNVADNGDHEALADLLASAINAKLIIRDQKSSGTNGGTFTSGAWQTRDLNTVVLNNIPGASLAANQITLPAGTYVIDAGVPGGDCNLHKAALYNITASAFIDYGTSENSNNSGHMYGVEVVQTRSRILSKFTLANTSVLEIRHQCDRTSATGIGFGTATSLGVPEIYTTVEITRIGN